MKRKMEDVVNGDDDGKSWLPLPCSKSQKQQQQLHLSNYSNQDADFFTRLPQDIVANILELLTLKDAAQTSILSHSFKNAFSSLRLIEFDYENVFPFLGDYDDDTTQQPCCCMDYKQQFITCVNQSLEFNQVANLELLKIHFCLGSDDKEVIDHWLRNILSRDVKELNLSFCCPDFERRPQNSPIKARLYSLTWDSFGGSTNLTSLILAACKFEQDFVGSTFNSLTRLELICVRFKNCDLQKLLQSMPKLEALDICHTVLPNKLSFQCLPVLKNLRLYRCYKLREMELASHVLDWLEVKLDLAIKVNWRALPNMKVVGIQANEAELRYIFTHFPTKYSLWLLHVCSSSDWGGFIPDRISKFSHLQILKLFFYRECTFDILKLVRVLRASPHITTLQLLTNCNTEVERSEAEIGEFMLQSLEQVRINGMFSTPTQIDLIIYLLKFAPSLKSMGIWKNKGSESVPWEQGQREHIYHRIQPALEGGARNLDLKLFP